MEKSQVYSWRLRPGLKAELEQAAVREGTSLAELLDRIAAGWLGGHGPDSSEKRLQEQLHAAARECFGAIEGRDPSRSSRVRELVRARLGKKRRG